MKPSVVQVHGLRKTFGGKVVLDRVDLSIEPGVIVTLLGANGAGKTTLLKILATLLRPSGGSLRVAGHDVTREPESVRRRIGLLAHGSYVYGDLTAVENLRFWAVLAGLAAGSERLREALSRVELDHVADERVRSFSAGMKRRLALARALMGSPRLLLLDEPFAGLDQRAKKWLEEFLLAFKDGGGAVLLATHDFSRGLTVTDRIVILASGRIALGRPRSELSVEELRRLYDLAIEEAG